MCFILVLIWGTSWGGCGIFRVWGSNFWTYDIRDRPGGLQPGPAHYSLLPDLCYTLLLLCLSFLP